MVERLESQTLTCTVSASKWYVVWRDVTACLHPENRVQHIAGFTSVAVRVQIKTACDVSPRP